MPFFDMDYLIANPFLALSGQPTTVYYQDIAIDI